MQVRVPNQTDLAVPPEPTTFAIAGLGLPGMGRQKLFFSVDDYLAFERVDALRRTQRAAGESRRQRGRLAVWPFGSLWINEFGSREHRAMLSRWPLPRPRQWAQYVNAPQTEAELVALRRSCVRGTPYGSAEWVNKTAKALGLEATLRKPGRPKKQ